MGWDHSKCMEQPPPLDSGSPTSSRCVLRRTGFEVPGSAPHRDNTAGGGGTMSRLSSSNQFQQPVLLHGKFTRCPISHDASCPSDCVVTEAPLRKHASVFLRHRLIREINTLFRYKIITFMIIMMMTMSIIIKRRHRADAQSILR